MLFLPLYLSFHLDSLHRQPDSPHFSYFYPDSLYSHADSSHLHSHTIPRILPIPYSQRFPDSVLQFHILAFVDSLLSLYSLKIYFRKIVALLHKTNTPLFYYCITLDTKLLFTSCVTSSVLSPKIIYLIVLQVKNL